jgi:hypothetical protein
LLLLEVWLLQDEQVVVAFVVQRPQDRVPLADEQAPAGLQQRGHGPGPAPDVGEPAQRADAGVHQVEPRAAEGVGGGVHVRLDVLDRGAGLVRQQPGLFQRLR